ncbi:MAG: hypothetical protein J6T94_07655 [Bacteroidaceae bacterium]|nr:hypothetical protein [Bacteroidaceae bacterium]
MDVLVTKRVRCIQSAYNLVYSNTQSNEQIFPYLRDPNGDKEMYCLSPLHGRSYIVAKKMDGRYIVSKGNGLSYSSFQFLNTREFGDDSLGLLLLKDASRDFHMGLEVESLGIKTNHMQYVIELNREISLTTGHILKPVLLQYDVECPFRISDAPFMTKEQIYVEVAKWEKLNKKGFNKKHLIAAEVLIKNLRILHDNEILHNAISEQNYTWALELLDFELACSRSHPYSKEDDRKHVKDLFPREILYSYVVINYIAGVLKENIDFAVIDSMFNEYGFDLKQFAL